MKDTEETDMGDVSEKSKQNANCVDNNIVH